MLLLRLVLQALRELRWDSSCTSLARALPFAAALPNLERLNVGSLPENTAWLGQLTALRQLTRLVIAFHEAVWDMDDMNAPGLVSQPVQLPPLPSLAELDVWLARAQSLQLDLGRLPSLQDLDVREGGYFKQSRLEVAPNLAPAGQLRRLRIDVCQVSMNFAQLPALEFAELGDDIRELQGAASIAACSALSRLQLGDDDVVWHFEHPWVAEVLRNAPQSLRQLAVGGWWTAEAAAAVGALAHLEGLSVGACRYARMPLPAEGSALWKNLRALDLRHGLSGPTFPKVSRVAASGCGV